MPQAVAHVMSEGSNEGNELLIKAHIDILYRNRLRRQSTRSMLKYQVNFFPQQGAG